MRARRRLRGRHQARRPGMKGDWIELAFTQCPETLEAPVACDSTTAGGVNAFEWVSPSDISDKEDSLTIVRMVGEVHPMLIVGVDSSPSNALIGTVTYDEAVIVLTTDDVGAVQVPDPSVSAFMQRDTILWRRRTNMTFEFQPGAPANSALILGVGDNQTDCHLDIRVKRRLPQGFTLVYVSKAREFFPAGSGGLGGRIMLSHFNMRGYVKF